MPGMLDLAVHPRLRGELFLPVESEKGSRGSSPLTRGTLTLILMPQNQTRFIPAYAGNSVRGARRIGLLAVHPRLRGELT